MFVNLPLWADIAITVAGGFLLLRPANLLWMALQTRRRTRQFFGSREWTNKVVSAYWSAIVESAADMERLGDSWATNMLMLHDVHRSTSTMIIRSSGIQLLIIFGLSVGLAGWPWMAGLAGLALLVGIASFGVAPQLQAVHHMVGSAAVMIRWGQDDRSEFDAFMDRAAGLRRLRESLGEAELLSRRSRT